MHSVLWQPWPQNGEGDIIAREIKSLLGPIVLTKKTLEQGKNIGPVIRVLFWCLEEMNGIVAGWPFTEHLLMAGALPLLAEPLLQAAEALCSGSQHPFLGLV